MFASLRSVIYSKKGDRETPRARGLQAGRRVVLRAVSSEGRCGLQTDPRARRAKHLEVTLKLAELYVSTRASMSEAMAHQSAAQIHDERRSRGASGSRLRPRSTPKRRFPPLAELGEGQRREAIAEFERAAEVPAPKSMGT